MKTLLVLLLCASATIAQYSAQYDRTGRMVGLFNLMQPPDCGEMKFAGPVANIRTPADSPYIYFSVRSRDVQLDVSELSNVDRSNFFHSILRRGKRVTVSGYACGSNGIVEPVSISK